MSEKYPFAFYGYQDLHLDGTRVWRPNPHLDMDRDAQIAFNTRYNPDFKIIEPPRDVSGISILRDEVAISDRARCAAYAKKVVELHHQIHRMSMANDELERVAKGHARDIEAARFECRAFSTVDAVIYALLSLAIITVAGAVVVTGIWSILLAH